MGPIPAPLAFDAAGLCLAAGAGLSRQLQQALRQAMLDGRLPPGCRLPTSRELAQRLGVSRNTVVRSYEHLLDEGLIQSRVGDGSYVAVPVGLERPGACKTPDSAAAGALPQGQAWQQAQRFEPSRTPSRPAPAFRWGNPAMDLFPSEIWSRLQAAYWRRHQHHELGYGDPAGLPRLRELLAAHLRSARGLNCSANQVLITAGTQQAISIAALALLKPGDEVAVETPGYRAAAAALSLQGARLHRVPVDEQGLRVGSLQALGRRCRLVYVTPSHQFPTGVVMSLQRRMELLGWAQQQQAWVLEDDYDSEYRYSGLPLAPLASLDRGGRTLYLGSLSKLLFPGLRLGYLVAPAGWLPGLARLRAILDRHSACADQSVLADFIEQGHFLRHLRRMRKAAGQRREALLDAWQSQLQPCTGLALTPLHSGLHAYLPLPDAATEARLAHSARAAGLEIGEMRHVGGLPEASGRAGLVLGFAAVPEAQLREAVERLAQVWPPVLAGSAADGARRAG